MEICFFVIIRSAGICRTVYDSAVPADGVCCACSQSRTPVAQIKETHCQNKKNRPPGHIQTVRIGDLELAP